MGRIPPRPPENTTDKAEQILNGAMQEFLARGYAGTSMDRVSAAAGVSKATVYSYFQDKEGLFSALIQNLAQERLLSGYVPFQEPEIFLRELAGFLLNRMMSDRQYLTFVRLIIGESNRFPELAQTFVRNLAKPGVDRLCQYFQQHPELNLPDPEAIAHIFIGSIVYYSLNQELMHGKHVMPLERDRLIDGLMYLILKPNSDRQPFNSQ
ncbi:TetR/AcrR family transcriptional regulator [Kamptonema cortianum]|uniref:TetR/AcrR family transcriptional regulator n=1 Tax=Geitlerinema calcuttense NRMC-F 0142 TaxID=2922238 RepID=A0ABT7M2B6_9CYAN|nr:TetR/AcrR family transcriptional regulator [Geitlerinema calcuttense]MDI9635896.1 TetR/AcrR family transcriptional regulator [Geitlerinema splendidum]MDK3155179.1 TetR/AcrR family transcriptional regulator [Kamptonema cortianum]MDL5048322.1 TetR/AcrR family transcriptional regulator [Oscillatoria amoena NRMC-F 0135]MDL5057196.1 TetR/AcrR family transcriptional regulator [Geitlerinema calcuttense NRMC-F 0142]